MRLNVTVRVAAIIAGVTVVVVGSMARAAEMGWSAYALIALGSVVLLLGLCGSIPINRNRRHGERLRPHDLQDELRSRFGQ